MTPLNQTACSRFVESDCEPEVFHQFQERSGMCVDSGMDVEQADREAYKQIFGIEFWE